jgi:hypothetical protein
LTVSDDIEDLVGAFETQYNGAAGGSVVAV